MKIFTKNISIILILLTLSNCGFGNNVLLIGYNFTAIGPHPHRVTEKIEKSFPENGLGIVSLDFRVNDKKDGTNTVWRKMNPDGTFGKRITLTYVEMIKRGRVRVALDPGIYVMDGIRYPTNDRRYLNLGAFNKFYSKEQMGWDVAKQEPIWFSFKAEAGKELIIPDIFVSAKCRSGRFTCGGDDLLLNMIIKDSKEKSESYKFGNMVN